MQYILIVHKALYLIKKNIIYLVNNTKVNKVDLFSNTKIYYTRKDNINYTQNTFLVVMGVIYYE